MNFSNKESIEREVKQDCPFNYHCSKDTRISPNEICEGIRGNYRTCYGFQFHMECYDLDSEEEVRIMFAQQWIHT